MAALSLIKNTKIYESDSIFIANLNNLGKYFFREFQDNQQRTLNRAVEAYQAYLEAVQASQPLKGGMHWKKVKGREYLYKYRDRSGHGSSLGLRSPHTE